ncbi:pentatricopeptide repeat-containing protein [Citrus sinensis]|nr:pentatricopeptide repeat-containing protein [Citrus sinensis]
MGTVNDFFLLSTPCLLNSHHLEALTLNPVHCSSLFPLNFLNPVAANLSLGRSWCASHCRCSFSAVTAAAPTLSSCCYSDSVQLLLLRFCSLGSALALSDLHLLLLHCHLSSHSITENALLDLYGKCDELIEAHKVFEEMTDRDIGAWNNLISGYARLGQMKKARMLFDKMPYTTIVSWTAMILGYAHIGSYAEALDVFRQMQIVGIEPDEISIVPILPACAQLGSLELGEWIHMYCDKNHLLRRTVICNALIEMYIKCGCINQASQLFDQMVKRDVVSWSTMIGGLANHGKAHKAIHLFHEMQR